MSSKRLTLALIVPMLLSTLVVLLWYPATAEAATATMRDIADPDGYTCPTPGSGFVDFENLADQAPLSQEAISGVRFTTTGGYTWQVGDFATGKYNGKYPNGGYTSKGTHWAWLGPNQGAGRIDFAEGSASEFSLLVSAYTSVQLKAYDASGNLLATAGPSTLNLDTGRMDELRITRDSKDIAYVIVHDTGNFFLIDAVCTDAPGVPRSSAPAVTLDPTSLDFGTHPVGSPSASQPATVTNTGNADLNVRDTSLAGDNPGDYSVVSDSCSGATLAPDASCSVAVRFTPQSSGTRNASLRIESNAASGPDAVALGGAGAADATAPSIDVGVPGQNASYLLNGVVIADYSCEDEAGGSGLATCVGTAPNGTAIDTASVGPRTFTVTAADNAGNTASETHAYNVVYGFKGFFAPVSNLPVINVAQPGSAIPVKFSLNGDQGLDIFADGYPKSQETNCDPNAKVDGIEQTVSAGASSLQYNASLDQYTYVWKTSKDWSGCRQLVLKLDDGSFHRANFMFK